MTSRSENTIWKTLGFSQEDMAAIAGNLANTSEWYQGPPTSPDDVTGWAEDANREGMATFAMGSMGYVLPKPLDDWRDVGRRMVSADVYYFFGAWRDQFTYFGEVLDRK